jgi:hypothetical protein
LHPKQAKFLFPVAKAGSFMPPFFPKQRIWMQRPRIKSKNLHPKTQGTGILVANTKKTTEFIFHGLLHLFGDEAERGFLGPLTSLIPFRF